MIEVDNFINGKWYTLTFLYKDDIAVYTCDHSVLKFLRCISQSRRLKQTWQFSFLETIEIES